MIWWHRTGCAQYGFSVLSADTTQRPWRSCIEPRGSGGTDRLRSYRQNPKRTDSVSVLEKLPISDLVVKNCFPNFAFLKSAWSFCNRVFCIRRLLQRCWIRIYTNTPQNSTLSIRPDFFLFHSIFYRDKHLIHKTIDIGLYLPGLCWIPFIWSAHYSSRYTFLALWSEVGFPTLHL